MRPILLTPRLQRLASQVPKGANFVDVGTDHARLPVWLIEQGILTTAIATDIREGPLERARWTAGRHKVTEQISFRLGNGLEKVREAEADVIAIAGMGGETIADILAAAPWTAQAGKLLLLQPMTAVPDLRQWLVAHSFTIQSERLVQEGDTLYDTMTVCYGAMEPWTAGEYWAGKQSKEMVAPHRTLYLTQLIERVAKILLGLSRSQKPEDAQRHNDMMVVHQDLIQMKEAWLTWQQ